ncbi:MAG TPA: peroxidase-related enzyme [Dehalococcoidia bacterium]|nr:peroxidase-related enzyme [Dehalococcoidia bacterium]
MAMQARGAATRKAEAASRRVNGSAQPARPQPAPEPPPHSEPPASWFPLLEKTQMDPDVRALLEKAEERVGFCPNVFHAWAWRPSRFLKWFAHYNELMTGPSGLSRADREMIAVAVSMQNKCIYCLTSHGSTLRTLTGDPVLADRITLDYRRAGLQPRERAMLDYALKITREMEECSPEDIAALKRLGFSEEDVWDIAEVASMFNFTNRLAAATGQMPNREYHGMSR